MPPLWEYEETLVADARSGLTPAEMVDRKLQALLGGTHAGLFARPTGRPGDPRGCPGRFPRNPATA
jgi:hypothetical protein